MDDTSENAKCSWPHSYAAAFDRVIHEAAETPQGFRDISPRFDFIETNGGEGGIRTLETGTPPTRVPGVRLRPLGHLTAGGADYTHRGALGKGTHSVNVAAFGGA